MSRTEDLMLSESRRLIDATFAALSAPARRTDEENKTREEDENEYQSCSD